MLEGKKPPKTSQWLVGVYERPALGTLVADALQPLHEEGDQTAAYDTAESGG